MAGKSLFPLTTTMAAMMAKEFGGKLRLSYAGGADAFNIDKLFACGIWPITMATTELKPGGYQRFTQIGDKLDALDFKPFTGVDAARAARILERVRALGVPVLLSSHEAEIVALCDRVIPLAGPPLHRAD